MPDQTNSETPDVMQVWRDWLTETERQFNAFFAESMNQDSMARGVGGYMEITAGFQRLMADVMQRYLAFVNMPSRSDVTGLGETLRSIEDRLSRIEETLQIAAEAVDATEGPPPREREPARTRQPAGSPFARPTGDGQAVPEELRR